MGENQFCQEFNQQFNILILFVNELTNQEESMLITASVLNTPYDLIIGFPTMRQHGLTTKFPSLFSASKTAAR
jgi:hypothetical protein